MSLQKRLSGKFVFVARPDEGDLASKEQFDLILKLLSRSFRANFSDVLDDAAGQAANQSERERLPFAVTLSFEERSGTNLIGAIETTLKALFGKLLTLATNIPGTIGTGAKIISALKALLTSDPKAVEVVDVRNLELGRRSDADWTRISKLMQKWGGGRFSALDLRSFDEADWKKFLDELHVKSQTGAPPVAGSPPPAAAVPAPPAQAAPKKGPFQLTQLMGWLSSKTGSSGTTEYGFELEGVCRFPDNAVEYATWARLDVFGPDGSQLLTRRVDYQTLASWLYGSGSEDLEVEVAPTRELRAALPTPDVTRKDVSTVSGRLWFSDGQPFGARTVAIYVKPALAHLIDDCCPPEEFEFKGCCGEIEQSIPILQVPQALAVTTTDAAGYFDFSYVRNGPLPSRYALLQVSGLAIPLALELQAGNGADATQTAFPKPVLLQVDSSLLLPKRDSDKIRWTEEEAEECGCRGLDFGEPNRALDEFKTDIVVRTTDPLIQRGRLRVGGDEVVPETLLSADDRASRPMDGALERSFRTSIAREAQVEWDGDPLVAQALTISHGRILTVSQVWRADGYSLGDLRYSLPLAPLQKKNIAVLDWDRSDRLAMESTQDYRESLENFVGRERDISEIVNTALNEATAGRSDSGGSSRSAGLGFSLGGFGFGGGSGGSSSAWSSSSQNSTRQLAASFINKLRDQTVQAANAVRSQRVTVVQQVNQSESARAVTETVANRNACHAITVQYFEVLRHFRVDHELTAVRECLYIPLPITAFDIPKVRRWRQAIEAYMPESLRPGLEQLLGEGVPTSAKYADDAMTDIAISLDLVLDFPIPPTKIDDTTKWIDYFTLNVTPSSPLPSLFNQLKQVEEADRSKFFEAKISPVLARKFVSALRVTAITDLGELVLNVAVSLRSTYRAGEAHQVTLIARSPIADKKFTRRQLSRIRIETTVDIPSFYSASAAVASFTLTTQYLRSQITAISALGADKSALTTEQKSVEFVLPLQPHEDGDRKVESDAARARLLRHLNENVEFYHKAIWWSMDPDRRFILLDGFIAPNAGGRSVASVVENRLIAIIGNCVVMPVAPGIRLDYFDERAAEDGTHTQDKDEDWLLARYRPLIPNPSTRIAVPTRGVFAESVMGSCNGCEKIDNSRNWRYWEHPLPDEPTAIETVSLGSRAKDTPVAQAAPMPAATVVNQVASSSPNAPDPIGLASAIAAMANGNAFRDMTGLAGTQQNSRDALTQSFATTTRFGELGAELSKKHMDAAIDAMKMVVSAYTGVPIPLGGGGDSSSGESVGKSIAQAAQKGHITTQQAQDLTADLHRKMVEGMSDKETTSLPNIPEVRDAIARGGAEGAPITVSRGDSRVDIGAPTRPPSKPERKASSWRFWRNSASDTHKPNRSLPKVKLEIVTEIRDVSWAFEVGEKSRQTLILDCQARKLSKAPVKHGSTRFFSFNVPSARNNFRADLYDTTNDVFRMLVIGQTASGIRVMPDIDYRLNITVDPNTRQIQVKGSHDGFPSYAIFVDGKKIYDFEQSHFLESTFKLAGTSDVAVDSEVSF